MYVQNFSSMTFFLLKVAITIKHTYSKSIHACFKIILIGGLAFKNMLEWMTKKSNH